MKRDAFIFPRLMSRDDKLAALVESVIALPLDKAWRITIDEYKPTRSDKQNDALWGCAYRHILKVGGEALAGWRDFELHEYFCGEYFGWVNMSAFGRRKQRPRRTTTVDEHGRRSVLNKMQFSDFYAFIQHRMDQHGIDVPNPDPDWRKHQEESDEQAA